MSIIFCLLERRSLTFRFVQKVRPFVYSIAYLAALSVCIHTDQIEFAEIDGQFLKIPAVPKFNGANLGAMEIVPACICIKETIFIQDLR